MADIQKQLQSTTDEFQKLQGDLQRMVEARQKLEAQEQENKSVQKEFRNVSDDSNIYKLVGPILLKQEKSEAVMAVDGRLEFIGNEIKRIEQQITEIQEQSDSKKMEIYKLQSEQQQQQEQAQSVT